MGTNRGMSIDNAKIAIDNLIKKSRVHFYKPIQIAEILYRNRVVKDIDLKNISTYRNQSKIWRDIVTNKFVGRSSTSSARYQDDIFNENAIPPHILSILGEYNDKHDGVIESYIYRKFAERFSQMSSALEYCNQHNETSFSIIDFINLFWYNAGLRRSIDKIYEIVVYALFSSLIECLEVLVTISINENKLDLLADFEDFTSKIIGISATQKTLQIPAKIYRVGVTNAADRGLDMYANFGMAIQIKHLSLTPELAENVVSSIMADRIVIVCKEAEKSLIISLLNQIGWKSRIQSIITEVDIENWYEKALRGKFGEKLSSKVLATLKQQIIVEFPVSNNLDFTKFYESRNYHLLTDELW